MTKHNIATIGSTRKPLTCLKAKVIYALIVLSLYTTCGALAAPTAESQTSMQQFKVAKAAYMQGEYELAKKHLLAAVDSDKANWEAHYLLGLVLGQEGNFSLSIAHAQKSLAVNPDFAPAYSVLGRSLAEAQKLPEARQALETACRLDPKSAGNQCNLGAVLGMSKDFKGAYAAYKKAAELDPKYVNAYLGMSSCLGKQGDKKGQIKACRKACEMVPGSALAHAKLGLLLSENGDIGGSMSEGYTANVLRLKESWNDFLGTFLTAWASVFLVFAGIFAVIFAGSKFKPQEGEAVLRSFFLTFYKDKPGRFVVTSDRLVFVPEAFSAWFGSTNVSIQRGQIESINYLSTVGGGTVSILTRDGSVHQFRMPLLVLDPLRSLLVGQGIVSKEPSTEASSTETSSAAATEEKKEEKVEENQEEKPEEKPEESAAPAKTEEPEAKADGEA
ncbi:MAG TPA: tetratricopeptide repeat protein [Candidatus Obscuribacter sp.]|nr:tetratricopeptide repeat protein [Candidatus Obscuribacter sp.]